MSVLARLPELPRMFRFLIMSRLEEDVAHVLLPLPTVLELELDIAAPDSQQDVRTYLNHAMRKLPQLDRLPKETWEEFMAVLGDAADGVFICAS